MAATGPRVAMLAYPGAGSFDFVTVNEIFGVDYSGRFGDWYRTRTCALTSGPVTLDGGVLVEATEALDYAVAADLVVVPGWNGEGEVPPRPLLDAVREAYAAGARLMSVCTGAFILGHAGLLDHRRATTHWSTAPLLASLFPLAHVDPRALFVDDRRVLTAAGMSAGMDLALHVVRSDFGADVAAALARRLVLAGYRAGGQAQFVEVPLMPNASDPLPDLLDWMRDHLDLPHSLESLAARAHLSPRSLTRHFKRLVGVSPQQWLTRERVLAAQRLLETSDEPIGRVASVSGLGSPATMREVFHRELGTSPRAYRARFRSSRPAGDPLSRS